MAHRDELSALRARLEAKEQELEDAQAEIRVLRAAHAHETRHAERLEREIEEQRGPRSAWETEDLPTPASVGRGPFSRGAGTHFALLGLTVFALAGSMLTATLHSQRAHLRRAAPPLSAVAPQSWDGTVSRTTGPEVVAVGEECTVRRLPVTPHGPFDCRLEVQCGDQMLYGDDPRAGYVRCHGAAVVEDPAESALDGDPAIRLDLAQDVVTIRERVGLTHQQVEIRLR